MSRNFAEIDQQLAKEPALYAKTHLLSVSFDPQYDTPAVLRSYGGAYTGNYTKETFTHWDFAAPTAKDLPQVLQFFDVGATPEADETITHSLSTVVIGPDGKSTSGIRVMSGRRSRCRMWGSAGSEGMVVQEVVV